MKAIEAVKQAAKEAGIPLYRVGLDMGMSKQYMSATVTRGSTPKADTLARMLETCDYTLCAVPNELVTDSMLVIDGDASAD